MAGTVEGGKLAAATNKKKHGEDFYVNIGAIGGAKSRGYKFGHGKVDPRIIGAKGGSISRKNKELK